MCIRLQYTADCPISRDQSGSHAFIGSDCTSSLSCPIQTRASKHCWTIHGYIVWLYTVNLQKLLQCTLASLPPSSHIQQWPLMRLVLLLSVLCCRWLANSTAITCGLLKAKEEEWRSSIVCWSKDRENNRLIYKRERRKSPMPTAKAKAQCRVPLPRAPPRHGGRWGGLGLTRVVRPGEAGGGRLGQWGPQATGHML